MAKKIKGGSVEFEVSDGGSLKKLEKNSKRAGQALGSVAANAQEADRRLKGTANMSSNSTKNFAKQAQSISGGLVPAYATLAAQVFAVSAAFEFLKSAFNTRNLIEGQKAFSAVTGVAYRSLTKDIKAATNGMLSFEEAAQSAAIGTAAGLSRGQLTAIGKAATDVSLALGRDLTDSFNRLTRGITKAEPELLDELGIVLRLDPAMKNYAASVGKAVADLTQFERSQAIANEVLGQAEEKFGMIQKIMDPSAFALGQFSAAFNDLMVDFKVGLVEFLTPTIKFLSNNVEALTGALALGLAPVLRSILPDFKRMGQEAEASLSKLQAGAKLATAEATYFKQRASVASGEGRSGLLASSRKDAEALGIALKGTDQETLSKRQLAIYKKQLNDQELLGKKYSEKEQIRFRKFLLDQEALLMQSYSKQEGIHKTKEFNEKARLARREAAYKKFYMRLTATVGTFAATANFMLSAIGWAGMIALVISAGKAVYDFFNPPDPLETKLQEKIDRITESVRDLKTELEGFQKVQGLSILSLGGIIQQRGQAAASSDIRKMLQDLNVLIEAGKVQQAKSLVENIDALGRVLGTTQFNTAALNASIDAGTQISTTQIAAMGALADKYIAAGQAAKQYSQDQQALTNAMAAAINVSLPFAGIQSATRAALASNTTMASGKDSAMSVLRRNVVTASSDRFTAKQNLSATQAKLQAARIKAGTTLSSIREREDLKEEIATLEAQERQFTILLKESEDSLSAAQAALAGGLEEQSKLTEEGKKYRQILVKIGELQDRGVAIMQQRTRLEKEAMQLPLNNAVGTKNAQEILKVQRAALDVGDAKLKLDMAQASIDNQVSALGKEQLKDLETKRDLAKDEYELALAKAGLTAREAAKQIEINNVLEKQRQLTLEITQARLGIASARGISAVNAIGAGTLAEKRAVEKQNIQFQRQESNLIARQISEQEALMRQYEGRKQFLDEFQAAEQAHLSLVQQLITATNQLALAEEKLGQNDIYGSLRGQRESMQMQVNARRAAGFGATLGADSFEQTAIALMKDEGVTSVEALSQKSREELKATVNAAVSSRIELGMMQETSAAIQNSFSGLFDALLDGTKSLKQALGDMMQQLLADLAKAYLKAAALKMIQSAGLGIPGLGARYGGIMSPSGKSFAVGGIASGPTSGYMATLHGTEAVVPLGNDRSIPVELKGAGGGGNVVNVSVNVAADGQSSVNTQGDNMQGLGKVIGQAVQQELMRQKRPGGMLSPYGAA